MARLSPSLTGRVIGLFALALSCSSCLGQGTDQLHGMYDLPFPSTAVCMAQKKTITFRNSSDEEMVIEGAAISGGTDPDGNFTLESVTVGTTKTDASSGILDDIHIPANTAYSFEITYAPHTANSNHTAVLDIAYTSPEEGIVQVTLTGSSTERSPTCPSPDAGAGGGGGGSTGGGGGSTGGGGGSGGGGSGGGGSGGGGSSGGGGGSESGQLTGTMTITIDRIALVSSALSQPISTDPKDTVRPFVPVTVPFILNARENTVILPAISESVDFRLPPERSGPLSTTITGDTLATSRGDASGTYEDDGSLTLPNVPIHLKEQFEADFVVTLTTKDLRIPTNLPKSAMRSAGFSLSSDQKSIFGSAINMETFEVTLVGVSTFTNPGGIGIVASTIGGTTGAVVIHAKINPPTP